MNYSKLVNLYMRSVKSVFNFTDHFFDSFVNLEELDLSQTKVGVPSKDFKWPPSLKKLFVNHCSLDLLPGIGTLQKLEELHANGNHLRALPKINRNASITFIELRDNPLDTVDVSILAPLCKLEYLGIKVSNSGTLNQPERFCHCARLKKWIKMTSLRGEEKLICNSGNQNREEESCEEELIFSADILNDHNQCLSREPPPSLWELLLFALFFSILFPIIYFAYEAYNRFNAAHEARRSVAKARPHYPGSPIGSSRYSSELEEEYESNHESQENEENKSYESLYMSDDGVEHLESNRDRS
ncbi:uncharacterized protein LOC135844608 [Planococcus citri]|uniref:uncharacterized protein LOC135844608 n=1 Tax=Planococcus citri TaxID=170843 RepID=UPI0031F7A179